MNEDKLNELRIKASLGRPLFVSGPRGTGKTTLIEKFASESGREYVYINLEYDGEMRDYMESCAESCADVLALESSVLRRLGTEPEASGNILFIFDDLEYSPKLISFLTGVTLRENMIFAADLVTEKMQEIMDKCERVCVSPHGFAGFLEETGHQWYREIIEAHFEKKKKIPEMIHSDISDCYEDFLQTGGMPQAVLAYKASGTDGARHAQRMIRNDICQGFEGLADASLKGRVEALLSAIPGQAYKNLRFNFSELRKGTSYTFYKEAIALLESSGIALKINSRKNGFELYPSDCGLLCAELERRGVGYGFSGHALNKCAVYTALKNKGYEVHSWESAYKARLDCVCRREDLDMPLDIADERNHTKSLESYLKEQGKAGSVTKPVRLWYKNFEENELILSVPVYAAFCL